MIVVKIDSTEVQVQADTWQDDGDGGLNCLRDGKVVATFPRGYWYAVYESGAVTRPSKSPMPYHGHVHPGQ